MLSKGDAPLKRVLLSSPICKNSRILKEFLETIDKQKQDSIKIDFYFVDDNDESESSELLKKFRREHDNCLLFLGPKKEIKYQEDENTHYWNEYLVWRLAAIKDTMIQHARENDYDYIFFVDSDLILHPNTIEHLVSLNVDIVSEVFWTKWTPDSIELPQVWLYDHYGLVPKGRNEQITEEEARRRLFQLLDTLRTPGLYQVGGLGACTLISKNAINKGVSFAEIKNVSFWGEDRAFCIRAEVLGLELYASTSYPPLHLYRDSDLDRVSDFKKQIGVTHID